MKKNMLKKVLLLAPLAVLCATLFFLHYTIQYFRDTAYTFVYNTNVQSVQRFSRELRELSSQGFSSDVYGYLYTNMIQNYNKTLGEKDAVVSFLLDEEGTIQHSTDYNREYLAEALENERNKELIGEAFETRSDGEITLERGGAAETVYYHQFYSGPDDFTLFMCIEKRVIEAQLHADGAVIPISVIGLLLLLTMEYTIWLKMTCASGDGKNKRSEEL